MYSSLQTTTVGQEDISSLFEQLPVRKRGRAKSKKLNFTTMSYLDLVLGLRPSLWGLSGHVRRDKEMFSVDGQIRRLLAS